MHNFGNEKKNLLFTGNDIVNIENPDYFYGKIIRTIFLKSRNLTDMRSISSKVVFQ